MEGSRGQTARSSQQPVQVSRGELAAFLIQSMLLSAAMALIAAILLQRTLPRSFASGLGLLLGMLCSYPTIRILGRAEGIHFSFLKWFAISFSAAAFATAAVAVF